MVSDWAYLILIHNLLHFPWLTFSYFDIQQCRPEATWGSNVETEQIVYDKQLQDRKFRSARQGVLVESLRTEREYTMRRVSYYAVAILICEILLISLMFQQCIHLANVECTFHHSKHVQVLRWESVGRSRLAAVRDCSVRCQQLRFATSGQHTSVCAVCMRATWPYFQKQEGISEAWWISWWTAWLKFSLTFP